MAGKECENINVGTDGEIKQETLCDGNLMKKLFDEVAPKITRVNGTRDSGTGFFVADGDKVITNAHVATSNSLTISTYDGRTYPAYVEKYDDTHDLALLKIVGIEKDASRAVKLSDQDKLGKETIYSLGHPSLGDITISPGTNAVEGTQFEAMVKARGQERAQAMYDRTAARIGPAQAADLKEQLHSKEIWLDQFDTPGSSGSPQVNDKGELVAVLHSGYDMSYGRVTGNIPLNAVRDLLSTKQSKFDFKYEWTPYRITSDTGRQMAVSLELKEVTRRGASGTDLHRKPFFFDVIPDPGKFEADMKKAEENRPH